MLVLIGGRFLKRTKKKIKVDPACAGGDDSLKKHDLLVPLKVKRRVHTSAFMIGLTISMGPSSLLLTRQSDRVPAAETPVGNNTTISAVPATTEQPSVIPSAPAVEIPPVTSLPESTPDSAVVLPTFSTKQQAVVSIPVTPPVVENSVPRRPTQKYQVNTTAIAPEPQAAIVVRTPRANRLVQELKASKTNVGTSSSFSYQVNPHQITPPIATVSSQPQEIDESLRVTAEVNSGLAARQRVLIDSLKQETSNRLTRDSMAEWRSEESNNLQQTPATKAGDFSAAVENAQTSNKIVAGENQAQYQAATSLSPGMVTQPKSVLGDAPKSSQSSQTELFIAPEIPSKSEISNSATVAPQVAEANQAQHQAATSLSPEMVKLEDSAATDAPKSSQSPETPLLPDGPNFVVNEPTLVVTSVLPEYQVQAGDNLYKIARTYGISVAELANANQLSELEQIEVNQRLIIPASRSINLTEQEVTEEQQSSPELATGDNNSKEKLQELPETASVVTEVPNSAVDKPTVVFTSVLPGYQVKLGDTLSKIAHSYGISLSTLVSANQLSDPNQIKINQRLIIPGSQYRSTVNQTVADGALAANAKSILSNSQQVTLVVSPEPVAATPTPAAILAGVGGNVADETTASKVQMVQAAASKLESPSNSAALNLQTDIERLQQKYYTQQTVGSRNSTVAGKPKNATTPSKTVILPSEPINPEFRVAQAAETLKPASQRRSTTKVNTSATPKAKVATVTSNVNASQSPQFLREQQVSPQLPPLAAVDTYLPKPFETSAPFNGYIWPAKGVLTSGYGPRWGRMHRGIDIAAPVGTPIVASAPGVVVKASWNSGGYGKLVDIKHIDGTITRYAHNNRILVKAGQQVEQGQQIAEMGSTGFSTGPHSHFEIHLGGKGAVNPMAFLPSR